MPHPNATSTVAVFGAAGHTGRFIVTELRRRGLTPIAIGRDEAALAAAFPDPAILRRHALVSDPASLARALHGAGAVINCAGPFLETAEGVIAAALAAGIHYLDVSAEQASAQAVYDRHDAAARAAGVALLPAMGFYGGFADLLATAALGDWDHADSIDIMIGLDSWLPTRGTRITGEKNTAPRQIISGGRLAPLSLPAARRDWDFAEPLGHHAMVELPFSEINVIAHHVRTAELHTYLSSIALGDVRDPATPAPRPADASGRSSQRFVVDAIAQRNGQTRRIVAQGRDIYAFSASLICEAAARLLAGRFRAPGAHAPGAILDAADMLAALSPDHLVIETKSE